MAGDVAEYFGVGSAAMKPFLWRQLSRWHKKYVESGAELRMKSQTTLRHQLPIIDGDWSLYDLDSRLLEAYERAEAWMLSPEDVRSLSKFIGDKEAAGLKWTFSCASQISVGPGPGSYTFTVVLTSLYIQWMTVSTI